MLYHLCEQYKYIANQGYKRYAIRNEMGLNFNTIKANKGTNVINLMREKAFLDETS